MQANANTYYYALALGVFIALKFAYQQATTDDIWLLLAPTHQLVAWMTGAQAVYIPATGFHNESLHITIEKSCSGFNFWLLSWVMTLFAAIKYYPKGIHKLLLFPIGAGITYFLTLLANVSRILISIQTKQLIPNFYQQYDAVHQLIGIFVYLSFLIAFYLLINHILNEKSIKSEVAITR
jgi:exosortase K